MRRERIGSLRKRLAALAGDRRELGEREAEGLRDTIGGEAPGRSAEGRRWWRNRLDGAEEWVGTRTTAVATPGSGARAEFESPFEGERRLVGVAGELDVAGAEKTLSQVQELRVLPGAAAAEDDENLGGPRGQFMGRGEATDEAPCCPMKSGSFAWMTVTAGSLRNWRTRAPVAVLGLNLRTQAGIVIVGPGPVRRISG